MRDPAAAALVDIEAAVAVGTLTDRRDDAGIVTKALVSPVSETLGLDRHSSRWPSSSQSTTLRHYHAHGRASQSQSFCKMAVAARLGVPRTKAGDCPTNKRGQQWWWAGR